MLKFRLKLCVIFLIFVPIAKAGDVNTTKLLADVLDHCYARHKSPIPTENMAKLLVKRSIQAMRNTVATDGVANTVTERPNLENLMANATKKMMDHTDRPITRYVPSPQVSAKCNLALVMVTMEIALNFTNVAPVICPIVESTGRPGPDLLKGNTIWKGARTTCESVQNYKVNAAVNVTLGLHRATLNPKKLSPNGSCECHGPTSIDWEFCFFDICSPEDIRLILGERAPKQPVNLSPLLITPGILVLLAFSVSRFYNEFKLMSQPYRFVFSALMPVIWALTLLWFVLLFRSKNPLFKLLVEWPGWQRVAVLTPVALALREIVYHLVAGFGLPMFEFFDSNQLTVLLGIPSLVIIILISTLLHVTFVMPLHQVFNAFIEE
uniref:Transmembrane protein n=1 Tax=Bursaphelenchus xylophilus TaxID=6326 RepID=A0A1I7SCB6_BURXY